MIPRILRTVRLPSVASTARPRADGAKRGEIHDVPDDACRVPNAAFPLAHGAPARDHGRRGRPDDDTLRRPRRLLRPRARSSGRIAGSVRSDPGAPPLGDARPGSTPEHASWVVAENARSGSSSWRIPRSAPNSIEGFADVVSAQVGDDVTLYISTPARTFHVEAYRIGYYDGDGGRPIWRSRALRGREQPGPARTSETNMVEAPWSPSHADPHREAWPPGVYVLKLVGQQRRAELRAAHPPRRLEPRRSGDPELGDDVAGVQRLGRIQPVPRPRRSRSARAPASSRSTVPTRRGGVRPTSSGSSRPSGLPGRAARTRRHLLDRRRPAPAARAPDEAPRADLARTRRVLVERDASRRARRPLARGQPGVPRRERRLPAHPPGRVAARERTGERSTTRSRPRIPSTGSTTTRSPRNGARAPCRGRRASCSVGCTSATRCTPTW